MKKILLTAILIATFGLNAFSQVGAASGSEPIDRRVEIGMGNTFNTFFSPARGFNACDYGYFNPVAYLAWGRTVEMFALPFETQIFTQLTYSKNDITLYRDVEKTDKTILERDILSLDIHLLLCKFDLTQDMELAVGLDLSNGLIFGKNDTQVSKDYSLGLIPEIKYYYKFSDRFYVSSTLAYDCINLVSSDFVDIRTSISERYYMPLTFMIGVGVYWD